MAFVFLICLMITPRLATRGPNAWKLPTFDAVRFPDWSRYCAALLLPLSFWLQTRVSSFQSSHDSERDPWFSTLPIPVVFEPRGAFIHFAVTRAVSAETLLCFSFMSAALVILCWTPPRTNGVRIATIGAGVSVAYLAITAPILTSTDAYFYVFAGGAGLATYDPPADLFEHSNVVFDHFIPLRGLIYGPLWIALNSSIVYFGHSMAQKIVCLRIANAALLLASAYILRLLRTPVRAQLAFVLNPMLWFQIVLNCHNDLMGILPCLAAMFVCSYSSIAASILVAIAGCIKLPFLIFGIPAFLRLPTWWKTCAAAILATGICLSISWIFGGHPYFNDLFGYVRLRGVGVDPTGKAFYTIAAVISASFFLVALFARRAYSGAAYLAAYLSPRAFPWYFVWGLPYAVAARSGLTATILLMPLAAILLDGTYDLNIVGLIAFSVTGTACILDIVHSSYYQAYRGFSK